MICVYIFYQLIWGEPERVPNTRETGSGFIGASRSEPHTSDVNRDFPTIYNISSVTRMRIRRRGHGRGSEHFDAMWRKRASFVTSRDTEKERLRKRRNRYQKFIKESCRDIIAMKLSTLNYEATSQVARDTF